MKRYRNNSGSDSVENNYRDHLASTRGNSLSSARNMANPPQIYVRNNGEMSVDSTMQQVEQSNGIFQQQSFNLRINTTADFDRNTDRENNG
jgi:hypothetical protein